tara:strand:+ start:86 stop:445 length:360 start_codon:yes stop_codon:yes gene_type:complete
MSDDGMLHLPNAPNESALWSPANVLKAVFGFVLFVLLIVIAHGQSQTTNELRRLNLASSPQVKYEYLVEWVKLACWNCDGDGYLNSGYLNDKNTQGWIFDEFVWDADRLRYVCVFKRPL